MRFRQLSTCVENDLTDNTPVSALNKIASQVPRRDQPNGLACFRGFTPVAGLVDSREIKTSQLKYEQM